MPQPGRPVDKTARHAQLPVVRSDLAMGWLSKPSTTVQQPPSASIHAPAAHLLSVVANRSPASKPGVSTHPTRRSPPLQPLLLSHLASHLFISRLLFHFVILVA